MFFKQTTAISAICLWIGLMFSCHIGVCRMQCLTEQAYQDTCVSPYLTWANSNDWPGMCSATGLEVLSCIQEHRDVCGYVHAELDQTFTEMFNSFGYNFSFFCEWQQEVLCRNNVPQCFTQIPSFVNTDGLFHGFQEFFCGTNYVLGAVTCSEEFIQACPVTIDIYRNNLLTIHTDGGIIFHKALELQVKQQCSSLTTAGVSCLSQKEEELVNNCGANPNIDIPKSLIQCRHTDQTETCLSSTCGSDVSTFFIGMFKFLDCGQQVTACPTFEDSFGTWPVTNVGKSVDLPCSERYDGLNSRACDIDGWQENVLSTCKLKPNVIEGLRNQTDDLDNLPPEEVSVKVENITAETDAISDDEGFGQNGTNIQTILDITKDVVEAVDKTNTNTSDAANNNIFNTISNLLDEDNEDGWQTLDSDNDEENTEVAQVMKIVDDFIEVLQENLCESGLSDGEVKETDTENLYVEIGRRSAGINVTFPNKKDTGSMINIDRQALISKGLSDVCFGGASYPTIGEFLDAGVYIDGSKADDNKGLTVNSDVISIQVRGLSGSNTRNLDPPLQIHLKMKKRGYEKPVCVFWDFDKTEGDEKGAWSTEGCSVYEVRNDTVECRCNHFTNFAILMSPIEISSKHAQALEIISMVGCGISILCLVLTIFVHCLVWRLVKSDRAIVLMNLCVALLLALIVFLAGVNRTESKEACAAIAALIQFLFLVVFFMMLLIGIEILICVIHVFVTKFRVKVLVPVAWLIPAIIVAVCLGVTKTEGFGNNRFCWLETESGLIWAFIGPAAAIVLVNVVILVIVLRKMASSRAMKSKTTKLKVQTGARSLCVLMPTMGITWGLGILAVNRDLVALSYAFAVATSLQGLFIFLFHCVFNRQIRDALKHRQARKRSLATFSSDLRKQSRNNSQDQEQLKKDVSDRSSREENRTRNNRRGAIRNESFEDDTDWEKQERKRYHRNLRFAHPSKV